MKKLTILARKEEQDLLLQHLQSLRNVEVIDLKPNVSEELVEYFDSPQVESKVRMLTRQIDQIDESIDYLQQYVQPQPLLKRLMNQREVYTLKQLYDELQTIDIDQLLKDVQGYQQEIEENGRNLESNEESETFLRQWQKLDMLPSEVEDLEYFTVAIGSIETESAEAFKFALKALHAQVDEIFYSDEFMNFMITVQKQDRGQLQDILNEFAFKPLEYPYKEDPKAALRDTMNQRKVLIQQKKDRVQELTTMNDTLWKLKLAKEYVYNVRERENARELMVNSPSLSMISGWTPEEDLVTEVQGIQALLEGKPLAILTEDVKVEEIEDVPIKLDNAHIIGPFETVTEQYSLPQYNEKDPTPYFYPFHILFFGMMSGDLGYGIVLWLLTFIPLHFFELSPKMRRNLRFFHQLSYGTMAVGLFFGSFFGFTLPFQVMDITQNVIEVMIISVTLGLIHLFLGYLLKAIETYKAKDWSSFYLDAMQWMLMIIGLFILGINFAFFNNHPLAMKVGIWLILGNIIGMIIVNIVSSKNKIVGLGKGAFGIIGAAGFMGDIISYTRLAALGVSGANIGMAFNMIIGMLPLPLKLTVGVVLFIALHGLNIFLSFLGAYVHNMRLEYVEFFGKFYNGGGKPFKPLSPLEENIWIKKENE